MRNCCYGFHFKGSYVKDLGVNLFVLLGCNGIFTKYGLMEGISSLEECAYRCCWNPIPFQSLSLLPTYHDTSWLQVTCVCYDILPHCGLQVMDPGDHGLHPRKPKQNFLHHLSISDISPHCCRTFPHSIRDDTCKAC